MSKKEEDKRDELENTIYDNMKTFAELECSKCKEITKIYIVTNNANTVDRLIDYGWTNKKGKCICPKCSIKNKK